MPHYHCPGAKAQLPGAALKLIRAVAGPKLPGGGLDLGLRPGFMAARLTLTDHREGKVSGAAM